MSKRFKIKSSFIALAAFLLLFSASNFHFHTAKKTSDISDNCTMCRIIEKTSSQHHAAGVTEAEYTILAQTVDIQIVLPDFTHNFTAFSSRAPPQV